MPRGIRPTSRMPGVGWHFWATTPGSRCGRGQHHADRVACRRTPQDRLLVGDAVLRRDHRGAGRARARPGRRGRPRSGATSRAAGRRCRRSSRRSAARRRRGGRPSSRPAGVSRPARAPGSRARCVAAGDQGRPPRRPVEVGADHSADGAGAVHHVLHPVSMPSGRQSAGAQARSMSWVASGRPRPRRRAVATYAAAASATSREPAASRRDERAAAALGDHDAVGLEGAVGLRDRVHGQAQLGGQRPDGRAAGCRRAGRRWRRGRRSGRAAARTAAGPRSGSRGCTSMRRTLRVVPSARMR